MPRSATTALYDRVTALLDKEYFKDPNGKTKDN